MLVLTRRQHERIKIGEEITVTIVRAGVNVRVGIDAPDDLKILREELMTGESRPQEDSPAA